MNKFTIRDTVFLKLLSLVLVSFIIAHTVQAIEQNCQHHCTQVEGTIAAGHSSLARKVPQNSERELPAESFTLWSLNLNRQHNQSAKTTPLQVEEMVVLSSSGKNRAVNFRSGQAEIDPDAALSIKALIKRLKNKKHLRLHFIGHTDNQQLSARARKIYRDNQQLSEVRARKVADYFKKQLGLSDKDVTTEGKAFSQPLATNNTLEGMRKNRRVEMQIWYDRMQALERPALTKESLPAMTICQGEINKQSLLSQFKGFKISVDGQAINSATIEHSADEQRCTDVALEKASVQLQYDNLSLNPALNVTTEIVLKKNQFQIYFSGYSNYLAFIDRAEVRIFSKDNSIQSQPEKIIQLDKNLQGDWKFNFQQPHKFEYVLRVYGNNGHFDETRRQTLALDKAGFKKTGDQHKVFKPEKLLKGYGINQLAIQNINIQGGTLTLHGKNIPQNHKVYFAGREIPVNHSAAFVTQQIVKDGLHRVEVAMLDDHKNGLLFWRDLRFKQHDWFVVALADFTLGQNQTSGPARLVTADEQHFNNRLYKEGRLAFYAKGKKGPYRITVSVDTREEPLKDILRNFSDKSPQQLFRRLDYEDNYAVYGDDSTLIEDAPTQGKIYAKVEDGHSHLLWGNFKTQIKETDLAKIERGLYGVQLQHRGKQTTSYGEDRSQLEIFAASPGTLAAREEYRGTGGSLYYLHHQDITRGSERLRIEIRDKDSDIVLESSSLIAGQDYSIDSLQGRILLTAPLASTADDHLLVRTGGLSGHKVFLVINYEYSPLLENFNELALGGRYSYWFNDHFKMGLTASKQNQTGGDQKLAALDFTWRKTAQTYIKLELAQTDGIGIGAQNSNDGGFSFNAINQNRNPLSPAQALRLESGYSASDLGFNNKGKGRFYYQQREAGFSAPGQLTFYDTRQLGADYTLASDANSKVLLKFDSRNEKGGRDKTAAELDYKFAFNERWGLNAGLRIDDLEDDSGLNTNTGSRTDGTLQLDYQSDSDWSGYGFVQGTFKADGNRRDNNRVGIGGHKQFTDQLAVSAEVSDGDGGVGGSLGSDYQMDDATHIYLNYELDTDRTDNGFNGRNGQLVTGFKSRYSDSVSVYAEERVQSGEGPSGLTHSYGIDYVPDEYWSFGVAMEKGKIEQLSGDFLQRKALAFNMGYQQKGFKYGGKLEYRQDLTTNEKRRNWLIKNNLGYQLNPDWRALLRLDGAFSNSNLGQFFNGDYVESVLGFAYRPINNDRLNMLFKYTYLADLAPADQFTASGQQNSYQQKSHVVAIDTLYELTHRWTVGAKYAQRVGKVRQRRGSGSWFSSKAELMILRADWHVIRRWDLMLEFRKLHSDLAQDRKQGALLALYRHFGEFMKLGVGYNFTDFSDDLTQLDFQSEGWFVNITGKY